MSVWDGRDEYYLILDELTAPEGYGVGDHVRMPPKPLSQWSRSAQNAFNNPHPSQYGEGLNATNPFVQTGSLVDAFPNMSIEELIARQVRDAAAHAQRYPMAWYLDQLGDA